MTMTMTSPDTEKVRYKNPVDNKIYTKQQMLNGGWTEDELTELPRFYNVNNKYHSYEDLLKSGWDDEKIEREILGKKKGQPKQPVPTENDPQPETTSKELPDDFQEYKSWLEKKSDTADFGTYGTLKKDNVDEDSFLKWYHDMSKKMGLHPNPDHPEHQYDYRGYYQEFGEEPLEPGDHFPSQYKYNDHPNRFVRTKDGMMDTISGEIVPEAIEYNQATYIRDNDNNILAKSHKATEFVNLTEKYADDPTMKPFMDMVRKRINTKWGKYQTYQRSEAEIKADEERAGIRTEIADLEKKIYEFDQQTDSKAHLMGPAGLSSEPNRNRSIEYEKLRERRKILIEKLETGPLNFFDYTKKMEEKAGQQFTSKPVEASREMLNQRSDWLAREFMSEEDNMEFDLKEQLGQKLAELNKIKNPEGEGATVDQEQLVRKQGEISDIRSKIYGLLDQRRQKVQERHKELQIALEATDDEKEKKYLKDELRFVEAMSMDLFKADGDPKKYEQLRAERAINETDFNLMDVVPKGTKARDALNMVLQVLATEYEDKVNLTHNAKTHLGAWVESMKDKYGSHANGPYERLYGEEGLHHQMRAIAPLVMMNRLPVEYLEDEERSVKDGWFSRAWDNIKKTGDMAYRQATQSLYPMTYSSLSTQKQLSNTAMTTMQEIGIDKLIEPTVKKSLKTRTEYKDFSAADFGEMMGPTLAILEPMAEGALLVGLASKFVKPLANLRKAGLIRTYKGTNKVRRAAEAGKRLLARGAYSGLEYQTAGLLHSGNRVIQDEADFLSGMFGAFGEGFITKLGQKVMIPKFINMAFKGRMKEYVDRLTNIGGRFIGRGFGETSEETAQTTWQMYRDTEHWDDFKKQFDDLFLDKSELFHFTAMTFMMGIGMGGGNTLGQIMAETYRENMGKLSPEERMAFEQNAPTMIRYINNQKHKMVINDAKEMNSENIAILLDDAIKGKEELLQKIREKTQQGKPQEDIDELKKDLFELEKSEVEYRRILKERGIENHKEAPLAIEQYAQLHQDKYNTQRELGTLAKANVPPDDERFVSALNKLARINKTLKRLAPGETFDGKKINLVEKEGKPDFRSSKKGGIIEPTVVTDQNDIDFEIEQNAQDYGITFNPYRDVPEKVWNTLMDLQGDNPENTRITVAQAERVAKYLTKLYDQLEAMSESKQRNLSRGMIATIQQDIASKLTTLENIVTIKKESGTLKSDVTPIQKLADQYRTAFQEKAAEKFFKTTDEQTKAEADKKGAEEAEREAQAKEMRKKRLEKHRIRRDKKIEHLTKEVNDEIASTSAQLNTLQEQLDEALESGFTTDSDWINMYKSRIKTLKTKLDELHKQKQTILKSGKKEGEVTDESAKKKIKKEKLVKELDEKGYELVEIENEPTFHSNRRSRGGKSGASPRQVQQGDILDLNYTPRNKMTPDQKRLRQTTTGRPYKHLLQASINGVDVGGIPYQSKADNKITELLKKGYEVKLVVTRAPDQKNPYSFDFEIIVKKKAKPSKGKLKNRISTLIDRAVKLGNDAVIIKDTKDPIDTDVYVVFEPDQIHILGSAEDLEKFSKWGERSKNKGFEKTKVKEGVDDLFNENPELVKIGTKQEYSAYLDDVFPESKDKSIVYHGSTDKIEKFDKSKRGALTGASSAKKGFFFASNRKNSDLYGNAGVIDEGTEEINAIDQVRKYAENRLKKKKEDPFLEELFEEDSEPDFENIKELLGIEFKTLRENYQTDQSYYQALAKEAESLMERIEGSKALRVYSVVLNIKDPYIPDKRKQKSQLKKNKTDEIVEDKLTDEEKIKQKKERLKDLGSQIADELAKRTGGKKDLARTPEENMKLRTLIVDFAKELVELGYLKAKDLFNAIIDALESMGIDDARDLVEEYHDDILRTADVTGEKIGFEFEYDSEFYTTADQKVRALRAIFKDFIHHLESKGMKEPERLIMNMSKSEEFKAALKNPETLAAFLPKLEKKYPDLAKALADESIISFDQIISMQAFYGNMHLMEVVGLHRNANNTYSIQSYNSGARVDDFIETTKRTLRSFTYKGIKDPNKALAAAYKDYMSRSVEITEKRKRKEVSSEQAYEEMYQEQNELYAEFFELITGIESKFWLQYMENPETEKKYTAREIYRPNIFTAIRSKNGFLHSDMPTEQNVKNAIAYFTREPGKKIIDGKEVRISSNIGKLVNILKDESNISLNFSNIEGNREASFEQSSNLIRSMQGIEELRHGKPYKNNRIIQLHMKLPSNPITGRHEIGLSRVTGIFDAKTSNSIESRDMVESDIIMTLFRLFRSSDSNNVAKAETYQQYMGQFGDKKQFYIIQVPKYSNGAKTYKAIYDASPHQKNMATPEEIEAEIEMVNSLIIEGISKEDQDLIDPDKRRAEIKNFLYNFAINKYESDMIAFGRPEQYDNGFVDMVKRAGSTNSPGYSPNTHVEGGVGKKQKHAILNDPVINGEEIFDGIQFMTRSFADKLAVSIGSIFTRTNHYDQLNHTKALYSLVDPSGTRALTKTNVLVIDDLAKQFPDSIYGKIYQLMKSNKLDTLSFKSGTKLAEGPVNKVFDGENLVSENIESFDRFNDNFFIQQDLRHPTRPNTLKQAKQSIGNMINLPNADRIGQLWDENHQQAMDEFIEMFDKFDHKKKRRLLLNEINKDQLPELWEYVRKGGDLSNPYYATMLQKIFASIAERKVLERQVNRVSLQEVPVGDIGLRPMRKSSNGKNVHMPEILANIDGARIEQGFKTKKEAIEYATQFPDMIDPDTGKLMEWEIEKRGSKYYVPGELVIVTRVPADDYHSHNVARLKGNIPGAGNIIITDQNSQLIAGSDFDGDKRFVETLHKNREGETVTGTESPQAKVNLSMRLVHQDYRRPELFDMLNAPINLKAYDETVKNIREKNKKEGRESGRQNLLSDNLAAHRKNNVGRRVIGIMAKLQTTFDFVKKHKLKFKARFENITIPLLSTGKDFQKKQIVLNGFVRDRFGVVKNHIGNLLNMALDNGKDPKIEDMGLNEITANMFTTSLMTNTELDRSTDPKAIDKAVRNHIDNLSALFTSYTGRRYIQMERKKKKAGESFSDKVMWEELRKDKNIDHEILDTIRRLKYLSRDIQRVMDFIDVSREVPNTPEEYNKAEVAYELVRLNGLDAIDTSSLRNPDMTWSVHVRNAARSMEIARKYVLRRNLLMTEGIRSILNEIRLAYETILGRRLYDDQNATLNRAMTNVLLLKAIDIEDLGFKTLRKELWELVEKEGESNAFLGMIQKVMYSNTINHKLQILEQYARNDIPQQKLQLIHRDFDKLPKEMKDKFVLYLAYVYGPSFSTWNGNFTKLVSPSYMVELGERMYDFWLKADLDQISAYDRQDIHDAILRTHPEFDINGEWPVTFTHPRYRVNFYKRIAKVIAAKMKDAKNLSQLRQLFADSPLAKKAIDYFKSRADKVNKKVSDVIKEFADDNVQMARERGERRHGILFTKSKQTGYPSRTKRNAQADLTIAIAINYESGGEIATKKFVTDNGKRYHKVPWNELHTPSEMKRLVNETIDLINKYKPEEINIAGNGLDTFAKNGIEQSDVDEIVHEFLEKVLKNPKLTYRPRLVRSGGQSGVDEAGVKAAVKIGYDAEIHAPADWLYKDKHGQTPKMTDARKERFMERFNPHGPDETRLAKPLAMQPHNIEKIKSGRKTATSRTQQLESGLYKLPDGTLIEVGPGGYYSGIDKLKDPNDWAKQEGFADLEDLKENASFDHTKNFAKGTRKKGLFIYKIRLYEDPAQHQDSDEVKYMNKGDAIGEMLASEDPDVQSFIAGQFRKHYPSVVVFNNRAAFIRYVKKTFGHLEYFDANKIGAAFGNAVYIDPDNAVQSTYYHEHAHIYWHALPEDHPTKKKLIEMFGTEEEAVIAIGRMGTDYAAEIMAADTTWKQIKQAVAEFWQEVKRYFRQDTKEDIAMDMAKAIWNNKDGIISEDSKMKMVQFQKNQGEEVDFDKDSHSYTHPDGKTPIKSVSALIKSMQAQGFNKRRAAESVVFKEQSIRTVNNLPRMSSKEIRERIQEVMAMWDHQRDVGTMLHETIQAIREGKAIPSNATDYISEEVIETLADKINEYIDEKINPEGLEEIFEEKVASVDDYLAGHIDYQRIHPDGSRDIYDFKTSVDKVHDADGELTDKYAKAQDGARMKKPFADTEDSKRVQHGMQVNFYRYMQEKNGHKINKMGIIPINFEMNEDGKVTNVTFEEVVPVKEVPKRTAKMVEIHKKRHLETLQSFHRDERALKTLSNRALEIQRKALVWINEQLPEGETLDTISNETGFSILSPASSIRQQLRAKGLTDEEIAQADIHTLLHLRSDESDSVARDELGIPKRKLTTLDSIKTIKPDMSEAQQEKFKKDRETYAEIIAEIGSLDNLMNLSSNRLIYYWERIKDMEPKLAGPLQTYFHEYMSIRTIVKQVRQENKKGNNDYKLATIAMFMLGKNLDLDEARALEEGIEFGGDLGGFVKNFGFINDRLISIQHATMQYYATVIRDQRSKVDEEHINIKKMMNLFFGQPSDVLFGKFKYRGAKADYGFKIRWGIITTEQGDTKYIRKNATAEMNPTERLFIRYIYDFYAKYDDKHRAIMDNPNKAARVQPLIKAPQVFAGKRSSIKQYGLRALTLTPWHKGLRKLLAPSKYDGVEIQVKTADGEKTYRYYELKEQFDIHNGDITVLRDYYNTAKKLYKKQDPVSKGRVRNIGVVGNQRIGKVLLESENRREVMEQHLFSKTRKWHMEKVIPLHEFFQKRFSLDNPLETPFQNTLKFISQYGDKQIYGYTEPGMALWLGNTIRFLMSALALRSLAWNWKAQAVNLGIGILQNKVNLTDLEFARGFARVIFNPWKTRQLLRYHNILDVTHEHSLDSAKKLKQGFTSAALALVSAVEFVNHGVAYAGQFSQEEWSRYDWKGELKPGKPAIELSRRRTYQDNVREIHGDYGVANQILLGYKPGGAALMEFRNWMPAFIANYFAKGYIDRNGHFRRGIYPAAAVGFNVLMYNMMPKSVKEKIHKKYKFAGPDTSQEEIYSKFNKMSVEELMKSSRYLYRQAEGSNIKYSDLDPGDKRAFRKLLNHTIQVASAMAYMIAAMMDDDDDDEKTALQKSRDFLLDIVRQRLLGDVLYFATPDNLLFLIRYPMPILGYITDVLTFTEAFIPWVMYEYTPDWAWDTLEDMGTEPDDIKEWLDKKAFYQSKTVKGNEPGDAKWVNRLIKILPAGSGASQMKTWFQWDLDIKKSDYKRKRRTGGSSDWK